MSILNAVSLLASSGADTASKPGLNSNEIVTWGVQNLIPIVLLVIGLGIIASARKGKISDNANTLTNVILGMGVIAGGTLLYVFAGQLTDLVFGN